MVMLYTSMMLHSQKRRGCRFQENQCFGETVTEICAESTSDGQLWCSFFGEELYPIQSEPLLSHFFPAGRFLSKRLAHVVNPMCMLWTEESLQTSESWRAKTSNQQAWSPQAARHAFLVPPRPMCSKLGLPCSWSVKRKLRFCRGWMMSWWLSMRRGRL